MKRYCVLLFGIFALCFPFLAVGQTLPVPQIPDSLIVGRFIDESGKEVVGVRVPGKPPAVYRAPAAAFTASAVALGNVPAFNWSFGCSATSAAMIAGYYDNSGYPNMYTGPTNGGVMPMDNSSWGTVTINGEVRAQCPLSATRMGVDGRTIKGHVDDYWVQYGSTASDPYITGVWTQHTYGDCTGDYMKTNQSFYGNTDGSTQFWFYTDNSPYSGNGPSNNNNDGSWGLKLFFQSRGYTVTSEYSQYISGYTGLTAGFTFAQYMAEIDAGRPVLIQVMNHTMIGFGYDQATSTVYLHDTWDYASHSMTWGGTYSGMQQYGVGVFKLAPALVATHTATNFLVSGGKYSFDICSMSTGATPVDVGLTSYCFTYNSAAMNSPVLTNVNSKYTTGSPTGRYNAMTVSIGAGSVGVNVNYISSSGTGDMLSTSGPMGERICTVTLTITDPTKTALLAWNTGESGMLTSGLNTVTPNYEGSDNTVLPVELTSFTATCNRLSAELKWSTATEVNNYGFDIEHRAEFGKDTVWTKVGFVSGNGSSNTPHDYSYTDVRLSSGRYAYRLKQVDLDGTFKYYKTTEVEVGLAAKVLTLSNNYPNPFNPSTNIEFTLPADGRAVLKVYNILGQEVAELFNGEAQAGRIIQARFDATNLSTGLYFYQLQFGGKTLMKRMLLVK